ncbi:hypothetical protein KFZ76_16735 [Methylovulum psychrotolerans]|uniref:hypothetical protein n=1 Tax=Methylovulum psychrotolerans TaxID=1704499 RepID=UPI001BFEF568|nr:hypothetical protein [Methylovulum psychrotolerans]MBT9099343.1 hypothetical protein [Methylovulum psychrotolerans]
MAAIHITHDDLEFLAWLKQHPNGYVLNTNLKPSPKYMILHSALCRCWSEEYDSENSFTGQNYSKVVAKNIPELQEWIRQNGKPNGSFTGKGCSCLSGHDLSII